MEDIESVAFGKHRVGFLEQASAVILKSGVLTIVPRVADGEDLPQFHRSDVHATLAGVDCDCPRHDQVFPRRGPRPRVGDGPISRLLHRPFGPAWIRQHRVLQGRALLRRWQLDRSRAGAERPPVQLQERLSFPCQDSGAIGQPLIAPEAARRGRLQGGAERRPDHHVGPDAATFAPEEGGAKEDVPERERSHVVDHEVPGKGPRCFRR